MSNMVNTINYVEHPSPLGRLIIAATGRGISGMVFEDHKHFKGMTGWQPNAAHPLLQEAARQLDAYFAGERRHFDLPLDLRGTDFQRATWQQLRAIPYADTISYAQLALRVDSPKAVRAVGSANGRNPVSIIVPCHRVISSNGELNGYAGGIERKRYLLAHERAHMPAPSTLADGVSHC